MDEKKVEDGFAITRTAELIKTVYEEVKENVSAISSRDRIGNLASL